MRHQIRLLNGAAAEKKYTMQHATNGNRAQRRSAAKANRRHRGGHKRNGASMTAHKTNRAHRRGHKRNSRRYRRRNDGAQAGTRGGLGMRIAKALAYVLLGAVVAAAGMLAVSMQSFGLSLMAQEGILIGTGLLLAGLGAAAPSGMIGAVALAAGAGLTSVGGVLLALNYGVTSRASALVTAMTGQAPAPASASAAQLPAPAPAGWASFQAGWNPNQQQAFAGNFASNFAPTYG